MVAFRKNSPGLEIRPETGFIQVVSYTWVSRTSLAILKVEINRNGDYLTCLNPFVLQILVDCNTDIVTTTFITDSLRQRFGLAIPERTVEIVLRRITRRKVLTKERNEFRINGPVPDPQLASKQAEAERHIQSVINGIKRFSLKSVNPLEDEEQIVDAVCAFLSEFDVSCLRSYLRGTAIPEFAEASTADKILVSNHRDGRPVQNRRDRILYRLE